MKTIAASITAICLLLFSYGNTATAKAAMPGVATVQQGRQQQSEEIQLNHGKKWKVDNNMLEHIRHMEQDVAACSTALPKDYKELSDKLKANINLLTSNCTMKGKAHDELHKWLLPYIDLVNRLSKAKTETEAAGHFQQIQSSFKTFKQYFQ